MLRWCLGLALVACVDGHGAGAWKDPHHYRSDSSLAGLRFISEYPPHTLNVVGTDDGTTWWALKGTCSGPGMTVIKLDFSSKGGPADATGTWATQGKTPTITWPDGNVWVLQATPTKAVWMDDGLDDHVGIFMDPHHVGAGWQGLRIVAESPAHVLKMVGADSADSTRFWYLEGYCDGPTMTGIHFDFTPKGGPANLEGVWAPAPSRSITWPDGNKWRKTAGGPPREALLATKSSFRYHQVARSPVVVLMLVAVTAVGLRFAIRRKLTDVKPAPLAPL